MMNIREVLYRLAVFVMVTAVASLGCGGDDDSGGSGGSGEATVLASADASTAEVGGSPVAILITAYQAGGNYMPSGTEFTIGEEAILRGTSTEAFGHFEMAEATPENTGAVSKTILASDGSIEVNYYCDRPGVVSILAAPSDGSNVFGTVSLECIPGPDGNWVIAPNVDVDGELTVGGKEITITATVTKGDGEPADAGVGMLFEVASGESLIFRDNQQQVRANTNAEGKAVITMVTTNTEGNTVLNMSFVDTRYNNDQTVQSSSLRVRSSAPITPELIVEVRKGNQVIENANNYSVLADGEDSLSLLATLSVPSSSDLDVEGKQITFTKLSGPGYMRTDANDPSENETITLDANDQGEARVIFAGDSAGTAQLLITVPNPANEEENLETELTLNVIALGFIEYIGASPSRLNVRGSGQNETSTVTFRVLDTNRNPLEGVEVTFSLDNAPAQTTLAPARVISNAQGIVETTVQSGIASGSFSVEATATLGDTTLSAPSASIPVVGARPSRGGWQLNCSYLNVGGFIGRQGQNITVDNQFTCESRLLDRFQNPIGVSQSVVFESEGGQTVSPQTSTEWPAGQAQPPLNVGTVAVPYSPLGRPPCDVDPFPLQDGSDPDEEEPYVQVPGNCGVPLNGCAALPSNDCLRNPRDGLVTIRASTNGEEEFNDVNRNGVYDIGEPFWDLGEPLVDTNDNNQWDEGEPFLDVGTPEEPNGNMEYDGPNGQWDGTTTIWVSTRILLTGDPVLDREADGDASPSDFYGYPFSVVANVPYRGVTPLAGCPGGYCLSVWWHDANLNRLNNSANYTASLVGNPRGLRIVGTSLAQLTDDFDVVSPSDPGWAVEFESEVLDAGDRINRDIVSIRGFGDGFNLTGYPYGVTIETQGDDYARAGTINFRVTYGIAPGVGGNNTSVTYQVPFILP